MAALTAEHPTLIWLTQNEPTLLNTHTALIGDDGWADGRSGVGFLNAPGRMKDHRLIAELIGLTEEEIVAKFGELVEEYENSITEPPLRFDNDDSFLRWTTVALLKSHGPNEQWLSQKFAQESKLADEQVAAKLAELGDESVAAIISQLNSLPETITEVVVATHIPPFEEACLFQGQPTSPDYLPYFCNLTMGAALIEHVEQHPNRHLTVLCGHTHDRAYCQPHERVIVHTAGADYGSPNVAGAVTVDNSGVSVESPR